MMCRGHAASGALAFTALVTAAPLVHVHPSAAQTAFGALATAGGALLPDADSPVALLAHCWGRASHAFSEWVHRVSGGHRHGTHVPLFAPLAAGATWFWLALTGPLHVDGHHRVMPWVAGPMLYPLLTLALRALRIARGWAHPIGIGLAFAAVRWAHGYTTWLPLAVGLGCLVHIAGDALTTEGVPAYWPFRPTSVHLRLPILGHAGSARELRTTPFMVLGALALPFAHLLLPLAHHLVQHVMH